MSSGGGESTSSSGSKRKGRHEVPDVPVGQHHEGNFRVYMQHKNARLHEQFNGDAGHESDIFGGLVFFIDGWTEPHRDELKDLIHRHGGNLDQYLTSRVTHIIATNLPHAKIKLITEQKLARGAYQQKPVVKPAFIVESVAQGCLLPHASFIIDALRKRHGASMTTFLRPVNPSFSATSDPNGMDDADGKHPCSPSREDSTEQQQSTGEAPTTTTMMATRGLATPDPTPPSSHPPSLPTKPGPHDHGGNQSLAVEEGEDDIGHRAEGGRLVEEQEEEEGAEQEAAGQRRQQLQQHVSPSSRPHLQRKRPRTAMEDPDFIQNFMKTSRLHFIGAFKGKLADSVADMRSREKQQGGADGTRARAQVWAPASDRSARVVIHVDMDCFFVSVLVRDRPDLEGKPVAVAHTNFAGTSEVSSCNYLARESGLRAGMWMAEAKRLCPNLTVLQYDFEQYEEASLQLMYPIFYEEADKVEPVSVDEAYLELPPGSDGEEAARRIRQRIFDATRCPASAGVSCNKLLARMATKKAKPNGLFVLSWADAPAYLSNIPASDLPGVGYELHKLLQEKGINTCADLQRYSLSALQSMFGQGRGQMLHDSCRGIDDQPLDTDPVRKSVGIDLNWGIRFSEDAQVLDFIGKVAQEVARRLEEARGIKGRTITLRVKKSTYGPNEPTKFLGCGPCENFSRSETLSKATSSADLIGSVATRLFLQLHKDKDLPAELVRGIGLQITRLERDGGGGDDRTMPSIRAWLSKPSTDREEVKEDEEQEDDDEEKEGREEAMVANGLASTSVRHEGEGVEVDEDAGDTHGGGQGRGHQERSSGGSAVASSSLSPNLQQQPSPRRPQATSHYHYERVTLSQVDVGFLDSLPLDVRQEVLRDILVGDSGSVAVMETTTATTADHGKGRASQQQQQHVTNRPQKNRQRQLRIEDYERLKSFEKKQANFHSEELQALPLGVRLSVAEYPRAYQGDLRGDFIGAETHAVESVTSIPPSVTTSTSKKICVQQQLKPSVAVGGHAAPAPPEAPAGDVAPEGDRGGGGGGSASSLFKDEDVADVRKALLRWLARVGPRPRTTHLQLLAVYLCEQVDKGQGDRAHMLLKAFRRWAEEQQPPPPPSHEGAGGAKGWVEAFEAVNRAYEHKVAEREKAFQALYLPNYL